MAPPEAPAPPAPHPEAPAPPAPHHTTPARASLGLAACVAIVIGNMVGSGFYLSPSAVAPYGILAIVAWIVMGVGAAYMNPFSSDVFGSLLERTLRASGARHLGRRSDRPTSLALVTADERGQPSYSFYRENVADRDFDPQAALATAPTGASGFYAGGLGIVPPDDAGALAAMARMRAQGILCGVDVNMRPQVARSMGVPLDRYRQGALAIAASAHIVKVSDEDLKNLGLGFAGAPLAAARTFLDRGCRLVILTLGAGLLLADRYRRDRATRTIELLRAAPAAASARLLGKYLGANGERAKGKRYLQAGLTVASTLFDSPYLSEDAKHQGLLLHSVYHRPNGWDHVPPGQKVPNGESSMWGDYHARELALLLLREAQSSNYLTFFAAV